MEITSNHSNLKETGSNSDLASRWLQLQAVQHFAWQNKIKNTQEKECDNEHEEGQIKSMIKDVEFAIQEYNTEIKNAKKNVKSETIPSSGQSKIEILSPPPLDLSPSPEIPISGIFSRNKKCVVQSTPDPLSMILRDHPFLYPSTEDLVSPTSTTSLPSPQPHPGWPILPPSLASTPPPPLSLMPKSLLLGRVQFNNDFKQRLMDSFPHLMETFHKQSNPMMNFNPLDPRLIASRMPGVSHPSFASQFQASTNLSNNMMDTPLTDVQHQLSSSNKNLKDSMLSLPKIVSMSESPRSSLASTPTSMDTTTPSTCGVPQDVFRCIWCQEQYHSLASLTEHLKEAKHSSPIPPTSSILSSANNPFSSFQTKRFENLNPSFKNAHSLTNSRKQKFNLKHQNNSVSDKAYPTGSPLSQQAPSKNQQKGDPLPRKLVRGQDVWLGKGQEQTRQILKCMWCGSSFKTLAELTQHMQETQHYTKVISQEQITSWRSQAVAEGRSVTSVSPVVSSSGSLSASPSCLSSNLSSTRGGGIFDSALSEKDETHTSTTSAITVTLEDKEPKSCISAILTCKVGSFTI